MTEERTCRSFLRRQLVLRWAGGILAAAGFLTLNNWAQIGSNFDWFTPPTLRQACLYPIGICAAFALLLLILRTRAEDRVPLLSWPFTRFLGRISYSVYLYHLAVEYVLIASRARPEAVLRRS